LEDRAIISPLEVEPQGDEQTDEPSQKAASLHAPTVATRLAIVKQVPRGTFALVLSYRRPYLRLLESHAKNRCR
jgi:hypothetical protein